MVFQWSGLCCSVAEAKDAQPASGSGEWEPSDTVLAGSVSVIAEEPLQKSHASLAAANVRSAPPPFTIELEHDESMREESFGVLVFDDGEALEVLEVRPDSTAAAYNAGVAEPMQLRPGDFILSTNGISDDTKLMMGEWRNKHKLSCEVRRPMTFTIKITKSGPLGVEVVHGHLEKGVSLVLESISDGPFSKWNQDHPEACVQRLDRIVGVNGCTGGPRKLKVALSGMGVLEVTIARNPSR